MHLPLLFIVFAIELVAAQSLAPCAQLCVAKTRTKCKSTDYTCACLDKKYITKLRKCIERGYNDAETHDATWYLTSLCNSVGVPLQRVAAAGYNSTAVLEQVQLELRNNRPIQERQESFSRTLIGATATATTVGTAQPKNGSDKGNSSGGGLSVGAKVGLGLGVPIGVLSVVGAIILAFWFGRKTKEEKAAVMAQNQQNHPGGQSQMMQPGYPQQPVMMAPMQQGAKPYMPPQGGPAKLSQNAQYNGYGLHTHQGVNIIKMPANETLGAYPILKGPSQRPVGSSDLPQGYAQPQPVHSQQQYYPPPQLAATAAPAPPANGHAAHQVPGQHQISGPAEVPERRKTPNMYE